ncbi:hypothetical protein [Candidatus Methanocrinis natronophilus]|jgi:hypothetical protein|uniref:Resolvase/invertase-type recombinase catalytic domain-containing protein n=1 Tax=Candidatus Methanocrinis natronophilus TaxID=3033396 RepID=A0ABT5X9A2_9EURY|nr:hypothetical protein [Candidatus Methanocrinis natronophilus]MDF0591285.1 hypothetical protein [Candidatus Methanocrinis natronophilus]
MAANLCRLMGQARDFEDDMARRVEATHRMEGETRIRYVVADIRTARVLKMLRRGGGESRAGR